jgi:hypothetical protein
LEVTIMQSMRIGNATLMLLGVMICAATAEGQLLRQFMPTAAAQPKDGEGFALAQEHGPWLIVAASFSGEGAQEQAQALAEELRTRYRLSAYMHEMSFKFGEEAPGRGLDEYGGPVRRRFRRGDQVSELAVLVGDFQSIADPSAQQTLERIKSLEPDALNMAGEETAQSMAQFRRLEDAFLEKLGKSRKRGPMSQAFFTRNPLLPREYLVPKGVDAFVARMNEGVEHGLLNCPGQFSVQVATFRGQTILQTSAKEDDAGKSFWGRRKVDDDNPLVEAAENAHLLTKELRAHGWEAYEFHDRTESIVTIGAFGEVAQRLPDGRVLVTPAVEKITKTFGAVYDTPADPLSGIGNDAITQRLVDQQEQQINLKLNSEQAQVVPGLNPKHVKILKGSGKRVRVERIIPIDVYPKVIEVPKRSISSAYAG